MSDLLDFHLSMVSTRIGDSRARSSKARLSDVPWTFEPFSCTLQFCGVFFDCAGRALDLFPGLGPIPLLDRFPYAGQGLDGIPGVKTRRVD
jgi:hypothetical protein